jgi:peptidoglycan/xylan/chitin deacetylase (PgdA/CDA1 family)
LRQAIFSTSETLGIHRLFAFLNRNQPIVLTFHGVTATTPRNICNYEGLHLELPVFARLMEHVAARYHPVPLARVVDWLEGRSTPPERAVVVTFDDGFRNVLTTAAPVLQKLEIPATLFVATNFVFDRNMLWPDRLLSALALTTRAEIDVEWNHESHVLDLRDDERKIAANRRLRAVCKALPQAERLALVERVIDRLGVEESRLSGAWDDQRPLDPSELKQLPAAGIEVGSHTCSHPIVSRLEPREMKRELEESKRRIEAATGRACLDFAYPNGGPGDFNLETHHAVREAGYRSAVTTIKRRVTRSDGCFEIPRCTLTHNQITMHEFASEVSGFPSALRNVRRRVRPSRAAREMA